MLGFRNLSGILTITTLVISTFFVSHAEANSVAFSKTSLDVGSYKYALVGDKIPLGVSVVPKTGGNFSYSVRIDEKSSTSSWRQIGLVNNISGSKKTVVKRLESKTGSFSYRAAISVRGRPTVYTPEVSVTVKNLRDEVRKLWYGERIAAEQTSQILLDYELRHTYPGLIHLTPDFLSNLVDSNWIGQYSSTPDLDSIEPDPTWLYPSIDCELYLNLVQLDISTPLKGRTFALRQGGNYIHITYLNGELYYFPAFC